MDLVSIIIPSYNRVNYLIEAVESCTTQDYKNIEVIIVDDGSTDRTEEIILNKLKKEWSNYNIIYRKQKNSGASSARNMGLKISNGEFIQFLDSDDILYKNKISSQVDKIKESDSVGCSCYGEMAEKIDSEDKIKIGTAFNSIPELIHSLCIGEVHGMQTSAPLWTKKFIEKYLWDNNISFGDDLEFHIRVLVDVKKLEFIPENLYFLRNHFDKNRLSNFSNKKAIISGINTQMSIVKNLGVNHHLNSEIRVGLIKKIRTLYINLLNWGSKKEIKNVELFLQSNFERQEFNEQMLLLIKVKNILGCKITYFLIKTSLKFK